MAARTIQPGELIVKDPSAQKVYIFNWTDYLTDLGTGETIASQTMTITGTDAVLTFDNSGIVVGNLKTQLRILAGTLGVRYTVTSRIVTNGTPVQTEERSFDVLVQDR